jgi:uncharacterized membrane protein YhaH (DUF805 family)
MGIMGVLFNPNGRIQASQFWQGIIVLVGIQLLLVVLGLVGISFGGAESFISFLLVYPYLCVFGKRLHDSDKSAWMFLLFLLLYIIIAVGSFFFIPGIGDFMSQYMALAQEGDEEALIALGEQFTVDSQRGVLYVSIGSLLVSNGLLGLIVARMYSNPNANKYGPPVGGEPMDGGQQASDDDIFS